MRSRSAIIPGPVGCQSSCFWVCALEAGASRPTNIANHPKWAAASSRTSRADDGRDFADKSKFTKIDVPGAAGLTEAFGINPQGDIVGTYFAVSNNTLIIHGFLLSKIGRTTETESMTAKLGSPLSSTDPKGLTVNV